MKKREGREKRLVPRLKRKFTIQYQIRKIPLAKRESIELSADISLTKDLSEKGVFFTTSHLIPFEATLEIKLRLPVQKESIQLEGRVVACEEIAKNLIYGVRIEFINLKDEQKEALRKFIQLFLKG
jgi:hypothetical protein